MGINCRMSWTFYMRPSFRTTNSVETLNTYDIKIEKIAYFYFLNNLFAERADFA